MQKTKKSSSSCKKGTICPVSYDIIPKQYAWQDKVGSRWYNSRWLQTDIDMKTRGRGRKEGEQVVPYTRRPYTRKEMAEIKLASMEQGKIKPKNAGRELETLFRIKENQNEEEEEEGDMSSNPLEYLRRLEKRDHKSIRQELAKLIRKNKSLLEKSPIKQQLARVRNARERKKISIIKFGVKKALKELRSFGRSFERSLHQQSNFQNKIEEYVAEKKKTLKTMDISFTSKYLSSQKGKKIGFLFQYKLKPFDLKLQFQIYARNGVLFLQKYTICCASFLMSGSESKPKHFLGRLVIKRKKLKDIDFDLTKSFPVALYMSKYTSADEILREVFGPYLFFINPGTPPPQRLDWKKDVYKKHCMSKSFSLG